MSKLTALKKLANIFKEKKLTQAPDIPVNPTEGLTTLDVPQGWKRISDLPTEYGGKTTAKQQTGVVKPVKASSGLTRIGALPKGMGDFGKKGVHVTPANSYLGPVHFGTLLRAKDKKALRQVDDLNYNDLAALSDYLQIPRGFSTTEMVKNIKSLISNKKVYKAAEYDNYTRVGEVQYHGTSKPITQLQNAEDTYKQDNWYGQGLYTTDIQEVAESYSKSSRGTKVDKQPIVYRIKNTSGRDLKLYDIEQPITDDKFLSELYDDYLGDDVRMYFEDNPPKTLRELYDEIRDTGLSQGLTMDETQEVFNNINEYLIDLGYDGIRHVGGRTTGGRPHNVEIYFWAKEHLGLEDVKNDGN